MEKIAVSPELLAGLGEGSLAYVKEFAAEELKAIFPQAPDLAPGMKIFALLSAAGAPILLADSRDTALAGAFENQLQTVPLH